MAIITDGLLIATCLTAALYCIVLSRRLARFSDTKSGIGEQISQLNAILEETRTTIKDSHGVAKTVSDRLSRDLAGSKKASHDLAALIERAEAALDRALELQDTGPRKFEPEESAPLPPKAVVSEATRPVDTVASVEPVSEELALIEEQPHDDIAERDFDLADARGEPQLGFLPNVSDTSGAPDEAFPATATNLVTSESVEASEEDNLLKVERMAL